LLRDIARDLDCDLGATDLAQVLEALGWIGTMRERVAGIAHVNH